MDALKWIPGVYFFRITPPPGGKGGVIFGDGWKIWLQTVCFFHSHGFYGYFSQKVIYFPKSAKNLKKKNMQIKLLWEKIIFYRGGNDFLGKYKPLVDPLGQGVILNFKCCLDTHSTHSLFFSLWQYQYLPRTTRRS